MFRGGRGGGGCGWWMEVVDGGGGWGWWIGVVNGRKVDG